jgi:DNA-binding IclR family transcriptional regulator
LEKTVVKGLSVLEALARSKGPRGVSDLARELGLLKSNVHRLLETLSERGYVRRTDGAGQYMLTLKLWQLGAGLIDQLDIRKLALPYLRELRNKTGETARLSILSGDQALCVEQIESEHPVRVQTQVGGVLLLYSSSTGKAILAFQKPAFIDRIARMLEPLTSHTISTKSALRAELEQVRKDGFAINRGEARIEVRGVAAPIYDRVGKVTAALGVSGPAERLPFKVLRGYGGIVRDAAMGLSKDIGYEGHLAARSMADLRGGSLSQSLVVGPATTARSLVDRRRSR